MRTPAHLIGRLRVVLDGGHDDAGHDPGRANVGGLSTPADADLVHRGIDAMLRHVLPLRHQSSRNLEHLVDASSALLPTG